MGGEQVSPGFVTVAPAGSSPHGRGTARSAIVVLMNDRFIPAWAGNRRTCFCVGVACTVHPRMGGEQGPESGYQPVSPGSSPHGRGTGRLPEHPDHQSRFIPAWAGNSEGDRPRKALRPVHPRMGGEQGSTRRSTDCFTGSSPHGRGTGFLVGAPFFVCRFIPAWAGNRSRYWSCLQIEAVHPRMGGEQLPDVRAVTLHGGSSPHGRGTGGVWAMKHQRSWFIPAWAGNSLNPPYTPDPSSVHPRMGGEQDWHPVQTDTPGGSSPHGRGTA